MAAEFFPLREVRITGGPLLQAQQRNLQYLMALDADRLLAPFRREAGLPVPKPSYGNWESTGLDGHMAGHVLSALALAEASTGDAAVRQRLAFMLAELKRCQDRPGDALMAGYLGGVPDGASMWRALAGGTLQPDSFSLNGRWVPWYNLHKTFAGLRDAHLVAGHAQARTMLLRLADWAVRITAGLSDAQMQQMLRTEHGGMSEVLVDAYRLGGDVRHLALARRFADLSLLQPLAEGQDRLAGLHANTQIPKVIGYESLSSATDWPAAHRAAVFFWERVTGPHSVAIGGHGVREHFHDPNNFEPLFEAVEGPETCNTYNLLRLSGALFRRDPAARYMDYAERAVYNHILSSQHPQTGGLVYFTPMRPNHYRVYSQVDQGMWCCVGSGLESHARYGELTYAHEGGTLWVNLFMPSTLNWRQRGLRLQQATGFPDDEQVLITLERAGRPALRELRIRHPAWVAPGSLTVEVNGKPMAVEPDAGGYLRLRRAWRSGDRIALHLPMRTRVEALPDRSEQYAVLHGPIVLAAKTQPFPGEKLNYFADDSRMGQVPSGPVCEPELTPFHLSDPADFLARLRPIPGRPLTFQAQGLLQGGKPGFSAELIPFFRLHESRYEIYWPQAGGAAVAARRQRLALAEAERRALDALTLDQVTPGEQQPEAEHGYRAEGGDTGLNGSRRWRHASAWFGYELADPQGRAASLRLTLARVDAGRRFDVEVNGQRLQQLTLAGDAAQEFYDLDIALPPELVQQAQGRLRVRFVARDGSMAGGLYGLRLMRRE